jgi:predicted lipoprotein with Yx(FWY)xxD motif
MFWESWTVSGHLMRILTAHTRIYGTPAYRAVYYDTRDTPGTVTCTAECTKRWPPLLESDLHLGTDWISAGALSFFDGPDGRQAEYDGHPLYLYAGDSASPMAQGTGNAADGTWFVVTPGLKPAS